MNCTKNGEKLKRKERKKIISINRKVDLRTFPKMLLVLPYLTFHEKFCKLVILNRRLTVPFWIAERASENRERQQQCGETGAKRKKQREQTFPHLALRALPTIHKGTASTLVFKSYSFSLRQKNTTRNTRHAARNTRRSKHAGN